MLAKVSQCLNYCVGIIIKIRQHNNERTASKGFCNAMKCALNLGVFLAIIIK